jgi:hypothetical protein
MEHLSACPMTLSEEQNLPRGTRLKFKKLGKLVEVDRRAGRDQTP